MDTNEIFSQILPIFEQNKITFIVMGVVIVLSLVINIILHNRRKTRSKGLLAQHPDAAKVFLTSQAFITSEAVSVHRVNDENPVFFTESGKTGFYAVPGIASVEISYSYTRPGITAKNVTKTYGPVSKKLDLAPRGIYYLDFDRKAEEFTFNKI